MAIIVRRSFFIWLLFLTIFPSFAFAKQLFLEPQNISNKESLYLGAIKLSDPEVESQKIYGKITDDKADIYAFVPTQDGEVSLEFLIAENVSKKQPRLFLVAKDVPDNNVDRSTFQVITPEDYKIWQIPDSIKNSFDKYSFSVYKKIQAGKFKVEAKKNYFLIVTPGSLEQHYLINLGNNSGKLSGGQAQFYKQILSLKLDWFPGQELPGNNFWSLCLIVLTIIFFIWIARK